MRGKKKTKTIARIIPSCANDPQKLKLTLDHTERPEVSELTTDTSTICSQMKKKPGFHMLRKTRLSLSSQMTSAET